METRQDWIAACDHVADAVLEQAGITGPPVDALHIARQLDIEVVWDAGQTGRARRQQLAGRPMIFLRPDHRPERIQWAAAHELGEQYANRVMVRLGLSAGELLPRQREELANQLANCLLLPSQWFVAADRVEAGDLVRLKRRFSTSSFELIAWRRLDRPGGRIVTIWDQGQVARRRCNFAFRVPPLSAGEWAAWQAAHASGQTAHEETEFGGSVRVWPIHESDWKREIAITECAVEFFSD